MAAEKQAQTPSGEVSSFQSPQGTSQNFGALPSLQTDMTMLAQRARLDPRALTAQHVIQLQSAIGNRATNQLVAQMVQRQPLPQAQNNAGLPDDLKHGVETLSGMSMDHVKVHYNSPKPADVQALAYTQGADIHVKSGQEAHLPHEAWHVVQQMQGRVQPTIQAKGVAVNDEPGLEQEATVMGVKALQRASGTYGAKALSEQMLRKPNHRACQPVVQRFGDALVDAVNNKRKVGVEITEDKAAHNRLEQQVAEDAWRDEPNQAAQWTHAVNLPDASGAPHVWQAAPVAAMNPDYFDEDADKHKWMKWGNVNFTEDHGDIEWIINHPHQPMGVTEYKRRLAEVSQARAALHNAMAPVGASPYYLSKTPIGADGEVIKLELSAANEASSQITLESNDREKTKKGLMEGLTHGVDEDTSNPSRHTQLRNADPLVVAAVGAAAARLALPRVDTGLLVAYLMADLCHKIVTMGPGAEWDNASGNLKSWRTLFPKSHPSQIVLQSMDTLPTPTDLAAIQIVLTAQKAAIIADATNLIATKFLQGRVTPLYQSKRNALGKLEGAWYADAGGAGNRLQDTMLHKTHAGGVAGVQADLITLVNAVTPNFIDGEYDQTVNAMLDLSGTMRNVVRSSNFAVHTGSSKGFAFEDRAEVKTTFPDLDSTYQRIIQLVNRY